jgi:hypothetical protein
MRDKHYSDDELVSRLFGAGREDGHLDACPECARRWESIRFRYEGRRISYGDVPETRLAAQRNAIRARIQKRNRKLRMVLAPSFATLAIVLLMALIVFKPTKPKQPVFKAISEDAVLEEVYQMSISTELEAVGPVQSLFEEQQ